MSFIILDRDGVINYESDKYIKSPEEWIPIPGSLEAIAQLNRAGFRVLIVTNQSGIARGYYDLKMLSIIHKKMLHALAALGGHVDEIFFCPHHPKDGCACRKPKPGLLLQIEKKYGPCLAGTIFIGDSKSDVDVANAVGCLPMLVLTGNGEQSIQRYPELSSVPNFSNLAEAVKYIVLNHRKNK